MRKIPLNNQYPGMLLILILTVIFAANCNKADRTLVEIGDETVTLGEFEKQYLKTVTNLDSARNKPMEDKRQFLNLYINFRLKVKDARERGLLNSAEMQKEISDYKKNFAPTYLIDKEVVEPELKKLYERKKEEVRASHILLNLQEKPTPEDSIAVYQRADTIIKKLENGEDFGLLAEQYSMDRTVKQNKGDLYYFTAGMTVDEFEDAIYDMKVGEFTDKPVRTMFGLHIVKLTDRKPRVQSIRASHILIQDKRDSLGKLIDSIETYRKALDVYDKAKSGEDFSSLVMQFSEDPGTKQNGGDLGYFDRRRMAQPFDSAVFQIKIGDITGPVRTQYGWHIIKKTDEKPIESYDKQVEGLKTEYKRTKKFKDDYQQYVEKLKEKYNYKILDDGFRFLREKLDSTKSIADFNLDSLFTQQDKERAVSEFDDGNITLQDVLNFLNVNRDYQRTPLSNQTITSVINSAAEQSVLNKRSDEMNLEKDDEYSNSIKDYENGLLVFKIDQEELWSKVKLSDNELQSYYDGNKNKYTKLDSAGQSAPKTFDESRAEISNELQQIRYKEIEKAYVESLKQKYPVTIHEDVLLDAFKE
jgi:peptidyl-prolyl cis-trans isomerase SurA